MAELVPCLYVLRAEFDATFPGRAHGSDGWIGDPAHQERHSDHNPDKRGLVHAIDVTRDLGDADMQDVVELIVARQASGADRRLKYVIFNRHIWSASYDWKPRWYTGDNPHDKHAHFSADSEPSLERNTTSWHLEEVPVALTAADKAWISAEIRKVVTGDADPSDRSYSLGGMVTTIEKRTEGLPERLTAIEAKLGD